MKVPRGVEVFGVNGSQRRLVELVPKQPFALSVRPPTDAVLVFGEMESTGTILLEAKGLTYRDENSVIDSIEWHCWVIDSAEYNHARIGAAGNGEQDERGRDNG
jgi:hypothetical protein